MMTNLLKAFRISGALSENDNLHSVGVIATADFSRPGQEAVNIYQRTRVGLFLIASYDVVKAELSPTPGLDPVWLDLINTIIVAL